MATQQQNRIENYMNARKVKRHQNSDIKNKQQEPQQNYRFETVSNELPGGLNYIRGLTSPSVSVVVLKN